MSSVWAGLRLLLICVEFELLLIKLLCTVALRLSCCLCGCDLVLTRECCCDVFEVALLCG